MEMEKEVKILNIEDILPNRFQPRIQFNESAILELAESIKEHGVIQPIVVRKIGDKYEIIAGERRYKASILAGKTTIPAIITSLNDKDSAEVALIENVQRENLTPIEEAISYKKILDMGYLNQVSLAEKLGKTQSTIANKIRLLNLAEEVQEALLNNKISERHARSLLKLDESDQINMLHRIINERLTVRKTDEEISKILKENNSTEENTPIQVEQPIEEILNLDEEEKELNKTMPEDIKMPMDPIIEPVHEENNIEVQENFNNLWSSTNTIKESNPEVKLNDFSSVDNERDISTNINPGFMDIEKIEKEAQDIIQPEEKTADLDMLLNQTDVPSSTISPESPMAPVNPPEIETSNTISDESHSTGKFFNMFNFSDVGNNIQAGDLEQQEVNMQFDTPKVNDTFMFNFNPLENISSSPAEEQPQTIDSADTYDNVDAFNPMPLPSVDDEISNDNSVDVENSKFDNRQDLDFTFVNSSNLSGENLPNKSIDEPEMLAFEPFQPYSLTDDQEFTQSIISPIDEKVTDYSSVNEPNLQITTNDNTSPIFNVREVVKELRACNDKLQQLGYQVEMEELDLDNIYQATFKISKTGDN